MQNVRRGLASSWILATFAGIGYVLGNSFYSNVMHDELADSMVALAGGTGIFLT
jgi:hypothetical protein